MQFLFCDLEPDIDQGLNNNNHMLPDDSVSKQLNCVFGGFSFENVMT